MKIIVTGGAGYIGSVLVRLLLEKNHQVVVLDNLLFGGESILDLLSHPNFEFYKVDVRQLNGSESFFDGVDGIAHLAAIVGDPACAKQPELARETNLDASKELYEYAESKGIKKFVFASTCSNYGKMEDPSQFVTENSALAPVSLYAETKVAFEKFLLEQDQENICKPTCLRFSTVYGLSLRPRFDLTVNEFTKDLALGKKLVIFGEQFWRPYCHVKDLARSVISVLESEESKSAFEVFNVGDTRENYTKKMLVNEIGKQIEKIEIDYVQKNEDPRDYRVNFDKIKNQLGFNITMTVPEGIREIKQSVEDKFILDPDNNKYKNVS